MEKWKECLRHGPPWKALIWKFAQPEGSKMQLKDLRAKWSVANWLWNEFYTRKCLHLHLHHLLRPFSTYHCQWVSQWLIVSDWRLISHLRALRACFILSWWVGDMIWREKYLPTYPVYLPSRYHLIGWSGAYLPVCPYVCETFFQAFWY